MCGKVDGSAIGEVTTLQHRGRQAEQEMNRLVLLGQITEPKILLEGHPAGQKVEQGCSHAKRRCGDRRNPPARAGSERRAAGSEGEEVQAIDVHIDTRKETIEIRLRHPFGKDLQIKLWVDVLCEMRKDFGLRPTERTDRGPGLAIEIR